MEYQRLTDKLVETTVNAILEEYRLWGKRYRIGYNTKAECYQRMEISIQENLWKLIRENKLKLCLSEANFAHFYTEFESMEKGNTSEKQDHIPWLYDAAEGNCEASLNDQRLFFSMIKKLRLTPDYFEPLPENIPHFTVNEIHQYFDAGIYWIEFNCIDDGGLLIDDEPEGKVFRLRNDLGLEAVVTIVKEENNSFCETGKREPTSFIATGYIEGFTAIERSHNPEIRISVPRERNRPWYMSFWQDSQDLLARNAYPLWQEFFSWCAAKEEKRHSILFPVFDEYLGMKG